MIEVFKTNVQDKEQAYTLLSHIHQRFPDHKANFDLADCDNILRVKCTSGAVEAFKMIDLLKSFGYHAEVLPDEPSSGLFGIVPDNRFIS